MMKIFENEFSSFEGKKQKIPKHKVSQLVAGWDIQELIKDVRLGRHTLHTREGFYTQAKQDDMRALFQRPKTQVSKRALTATSKSSKSSTLSAAVSAVTTTSFHSSDLLYFHHIHGDNVNLSYGFHSASRQKNTFCNGIVFGYRPIIIGEIVHIKFDKVRQHWRGGIKLGFTNHNPSFDNVDLLPSYAIPDPTKKTRYWAVPLADRYVALNNVFSFTLNNDGRVIYFINNENKGTFLKGLDVSEPQWPMFDLYGKISKISVVDDKTALKGVVTNSDLLPDDEDVYENNVASAVGNENTELQILRFHKRCGLNIKLDPKRLIAKRVESFWNSLTFTSEPFKPNDIIFIEVAQKVNDYAGSLGVGVTDVDPHTINANELPDNADLLFKKSTNLLIISRDIETKEGDQLGFEIYENGTITYSRNGEFPVQFLQLDSTYMRKPLWLIFDIYGSTKVIRILGIIRGVDPTNPTVIQKYSINNYSDYDDNDTECFMCYKKDRVRNCVIQPCGHRTFCHWCSITCLIKQQLRFIVCPVCGGPIQGVIKIISAVKRKQSLALSYTGSEMLEKE